MNPADIGFQTATGTGQQAGSVLSGSSYGQPSQAVQGATNVKQVYGTSAHTGSATPPVGQQQQATGAGQPSQLGAKDPFQWLIRDHLLFRSLLSELSSLSASDADRASSLITQLISEESKHTSAEEQYLHECYAKYLGGEGQRFYDESLQDDTKDKQLAYDLEKCDPRRDWVGFRKVFDSMSAGLIAHMDKEENVYWPRLQAKMPIQDQELLFSNLQTAKSRAPTHPHPAATDKPGLSKIMHQAQGFLDKAKDKLMGHH